MRQYVAPCEPTAAIERVRAEPGGNEEYRLTPVLMLSVYGSSYVVVTSGAFTGDNDQEVVDPIYVGPERLIIAETRKLCLERCTCKATDFLSRDANISRWLIADGGRSETVVVHEGDCGRITGEAR